MGELTLSNVIKDLRRELQTATEEGEREDLKFAVGNIELELELEVSADAEASGGVKFLVFELGAGAKTGEVGRHKLKLELTPRYKGGDLQIGDKAKRPK